MPPRLCKYMCIPEIGKRILSLQQSQFAVYFFWEWTHDVFLEERGHSVVHNKPQHAARVTTSKHNTMHQSYLHGDPLLATPYCDQHDLYGLKGLALVWQGLCTPR